MTGTSGLQKVNFIFPTF